MVAASKRRHNFPSGCVRISKRSSTSKTLDLRRQQAKEIDPRLFFMGVGSFKNTYN
jgi:hypothetical protein